MADSLVVLVPQAALFLAQVFKRKNGAEIVGFERVKHLTRGRATAETGNCDANSGGIFRRATPEHHVRKEFFSVAAHLPGVALLRADNTIANGLAEAALNRAREF